MQPAGKGIQARRAGGGRTASTAQAAFISTAAGLVLVR
jgi:hypothetical protein